MNLKIFRISSGKSINDIHSQYSQSIFNIIFFPFKWPFSLNISSRYFKLGLLLFFPVKPILWKWNLGVSYIYFGIVWSYIYTSIFLSADSLSNAIYQSGLPIPII